MDENERIESARERAKEAGETLRILEEARPSANPTPEDVAALHELHAKHERRRGRETIAEQAERRAERVRQRGKRGSGPEPRA